MSKSFDYEEVFMGVAVDQSDANYQQIYEDDYRFRYLIESVLFKKGRILDVGCGGGSLTENLAHYYPKAHIYGCDISKIAISYAQKFSSGKVKYAVNNKELPYKANFFDLCLCLDVLEHVPDIYFFLKEIKRVLKKNGLFYLVVPCEGQFFTLTSLFQKIKIGDRLTFKHFGHIHPEFTHKYMDKLLKDHKFTIIGKRYQDHLLSQVIHFIQYFLAKELLELFLGEKNAEKYYDRSLIKSDSKQSQKRDPIMLIRTVWSKASGLTKIICDGETKLLNKVSFSASKLLVLVRNG